MLYCKSKNETSCCFTGVLCSKDYVKDVHGDLEVKSTLFLENKRYLKHMEHDHRYDSCHRINGLDASKCAQDCEKIALSKFAKKCKNDGGLFKCCIRWIKI